MKKSLQTKPILAAMLLMCASIGHQALAQYPVKPLRIVVAVAAGGAPDLAARAIAPGLGKALGQPVVVENRGGANGNVAGQTVAQAPADGYTLLLAPDSLVVINRNLYKKMPFDPVKDLAPVASIIRNQFVLAVHSSLPVKTLAEFVDFARKSTPPIAYASAGNGSQGQFLMEMLKARAGIDMLHVPYKGNAPAVASVLARDTLATFTGGPSSAAHVKAGTLRILAGSGTRRAAVMPDVPTVAESFPGYEGIVWSGVWAPAGTPDAIVKRLHEEINTVLAEQEIRDLFRKSGGSESFITTPAEFAEIMRRDTAKYLKIINDLKLTAED